MSMVREVGRMTGQDLPTPACVDCDKWDRGFCKEWQQEVPVEAWAKGCNAYEPWVPF
jgi:hypothetical protein